MSQLVSILMPLKNGAKYLRSCLESIQQQSWQQYELIIVDDHSTDGSSGIVEEFQKTDPRIKLLHNEGNGIIDALQKGIVHCKGNYLTRMDADDIMPHNKLELLVKKLNEHDNMTLVTGLVKYFGRDQISAGYRSYEQWLNNRIIENDHWDWIYRECVVASPNWMVDLNQFKKLKLFDSLVYPEDYHLLLRCYQNGYKIVGIPELTLLWREHDKRTSRISDNYDQRHFFELKIEHFLNIELGDYSLVLWGTNKKGKLTAKILENHDVKFRWQSLDGNKYPTGIGGHTIEKWDLNEMTRPFKLLIAVYPVESELDQVTAYLNRLQLKIGKDYWFL